MADELTIQQVATLTQLSGHMLRYYERIGLVFAERDAQGLRNGIGAAK